MATKILHSGKFALNGKLKTKWNLEKQNTNAEENVKWRQENSRFCDEGEELTLYTNVVQTFKC
jgi:hypothetical protein